MKANSLRNAIIFSLLLFPGFFLTQAAYAQPPYIEKGQIIIPVVDIDGIDYRLELSIAKGKSITLKEEYSEVAENPLYKDASSLDGTTLTVPKIRYRGKNYQLKMTLTGINPFTFKLTRANEISENFAAVDLITFSPESCQADIQLLGEETFTVQDHTEGYKGNIFVSRQVEVEGSTFNQSALINLITDTTLVLANQHPPGFEDGATFRPPVDEFTVAPDFGQENDPDYPLAFKSFIRVNSFNNERAIYRSDVNGNLSFVAVTGQSVNLVGADPLIDVGTANGVIDEISELRLAHEDVLYFIIKLVDDDRDYLVRQDKAGAGLTLLLAEGNSLNTGDETTFRYVGKIKSHMAGPGYQSIVEIEVVDEVGNADSFAYLGVDAFTGSRQCLATDDVLFCGGLQLFSGKTLESFSTDGITTAGIVKSGSDYTLEYKVIANPRVEELELNIEVQGFTFQNFKRPRVCGNKNAIYFVGSFSDPVAGIHDELMRMDENGNLKKLTDFRSLLMDTSLKGQVPDEIRNWAIGFNCDAALYTWGPSGPNSSQGYEGHWASYVTGETLEIMDETAGRENGNDTITDVSGSTSGIDSSTGESTIVSTGPNGEFYFVPKIRNEAGTLVSNYAVATKPTSCQ